MGAAQRRGIDGARLLVVLSDPLSAVIAKGEVTDRYYNPANFFARVDFLLLNDDRPDPAALQRMCGAATVAVHNLELPHHLFLRTLAWSLWPTAPVRDAARALLARLQPHIIRCHGVHLDSVLATSCGREQRIPVMVSLHNRPDCIISDRLADRVRQSSASRLAVRALRAADVVIAVYRSQLGYLQKLGVRDVEMVYNAVAPGALAAKHDYRLGEPPAVVCVGRQIPGKDPSRLLRAVQQIPEVRLTLIGDGPLHGRLRRLTDSLGIAERVGFETAMDNRELCAALPRYDLFATHNDHPGVPKAVLEPLLSGLPVLINCNAREPVPELDGGICLQVADTADGYREGLRQLLGDQALRERFGRAARKRALAEWEPAGCERKIADIYAGLLTAAGAARV